MICEVKLLHTVVNGLGTSVANGWSDFINDTVRVQIQLFPSPFLHSTQRIHKLE